MVEIEAGQRWQAIGAPADRVVTLGPDGDDAWRARMAVGVERSMLTSVLLDSYVLAGSGESDLRPPASDDLLSQFKQMVRKDRQQK